MSTQTTERRKVWDRSGRLLGHFAAIAFDETGEQWLWYVDETYTMRHIELNRTWGSETPPRVGYSQKRGPRRKKRGIVEETG